MRRSPRKVYSPPTTFSAKRPKESMVTFAAYVMRMVAVWVPLLNSAVV